MRKNIIVILLASIMQTASVYGMDAAITNPISSFYGQQIDLNDNFWPASCLTRARSALQIYKIYKSELKSPAGLDWYARTIQLITFYRQLDQLDAFSRLTYVDLKKLNEQINIFKKDPGLEDFLNPPHPMLNSMQAIILILRDTVQRKSWPIKQMRVCYDYLRILFSAWETSICTRGDLDQLIDMIQAMTPADIASLKQFGEFIDERDDLQNLWSEIFYNVATDRRSLASQGLNLGYPRENLEAAAKVLNFERSNRPSATTYVTPTPTPVTTTITVTPPAPTPTPSTPTPSTPSAPATPYVPTPQMTYGPSTPSPMGTPSVTPTPAITPGASTSYGYTTQEVGSVPPGPRQAPYDVTITPGASLTQDQMHSELRRLKIRADWLRKNMPQ